MILSQPKRLQNSRLNYFLKLANVKEIKQPLILRKVKKMVY